MLAALLDFQWPISIPDHISFDKVGLTMSWFLITGIVASTWLVCTFRRKLHEARIAKERS